MGLPVARTKIAVYAISGFCSALGGLLFALYTLSGLRRCTPSAWSSTRSPRSSSAARCSPAARGFVLGSLLGVLVLGMIQTFISFDGTLSSWWTKIVIGALLLVFVVLQRIFVRRPG